MSAGAGSSSLSDARPQRGFWRRGLLSASGARHPGSVRFCGSLDRGACRSDGNRVVSANPGWVDTGRRRRRLSDVGDGAPDCSA